MKKKNMLLLLLLCATSFLLVGCGEKDEEKESEKDTTKTEQKENSGLQSMSCTLIDEDFEDVMRLTMTMDFDYDTTKKEVVSGSLKTTMKVTSDDVTDEEMTIFKETDFCKDGTLSDFEDYANSCNTNVDGKVSTSVVEFDIDKLAQASDEEGTFRKDMTLEEIQKTLIAEYDGAKCTIK